MKLFEKLIYTGVVFLASYVVISLGLRLFSITSVYDSHMYGGIIATILGMLTFMYLLIKK